MEPLSIYFTLNVDSKNVKCSVNEELCTVGKYTVLSVKIRFGRVIQDVNMISELILAPFIT